MPIIKLGELYVHGIVRDESSTNSFNSRSGKPSITLTLSGQAKDIDPLSMKSILPEIIDLQRFGDAPKYTIKIEWE